MKERKNGLFSVMTRIEGMSNQFTKTDWKIVQYMNCLLYTSGYGADYASGLLSGGVPTGDYLVSSDPDHAETGGAGLDWF